MISTLLHVEDDDALRAIVQREFEALGFDGRHLSAPTIATGEKILEEMARDNEEVSLIISDMSLPDGTGLDFVRYVRTSDAWSHTPMLILADDVDGKKVGCAYALGANAYVDKSPAGSSLSEVVTTLYRHWVRDVVVPAAFHRGRIEQLFARSLKLRGRFATFYQRIAELLGDDPNESAFWLSRALSESNLINLFAFLQRAVGEEDVPQPIVERMERMQQAIENQLTAAELRLTRGATNRADVYRMLVDMLSAISFDTLAQSISYLFPVVPVAMTALRDFSIGTVLDVTGWVDLHTDDNALRERAAQLRADATSELVRLDRPLSDRSLGVLR